MRAARVLAQAKVNLLLRVGASDAAGYHEVATQLQRIDLADEVTVRVGGGDRSISCGGPLMPGGGFGPPESNLAYRAARAYAERCGWLTGFSIEIVKHIPAGGGLGGGSADAGAVLRCLDAMAPEPLASDALGAVARSLGADVPFLASEQPSAFATGRGDVCHSLDPLPERPIVLAMPDFSISTAEAYRLLDEAGGGSLPAARVVTSADVGRQAPLETFGLRSWTEARGGSHNDFERALEPRFPLLGTLRDSLASAGAIVARLSGSGSTVFAVFEDDPPPSRDLSLEALVIRARTSARVVQVEVLE